MARETQPLDILVIEDNPGDLFLLQELLRDTDLSIDRIHHADHLSEARRQLENERIDLVFLDLSLPDSSGLGSYTGLSPFNQRVPVILLTGLADTNLALEALLLGAQDYLVKGDFDNKLLSRAIRYSRERMRSMQYLRESEERYRELFNNNPMPMWVFDPDTFRFLEANDAAVQHYGYTKEEFMSKTVADIRLDGSWEGLREEVMESRHARDGIRKGIR